MNSKLENRPDLLRAAHCFRMACAHSRAHTILARDALLVYGNHGPDISGCVRDHFPDNVKDLLRESAREVSRACDAAYAARPSRVHMATMRRLSREIAARYGSGFYGPRP